MVQDASQIGDGITETGAEQAETVQASAQKAEVMTKIRETVTDNTAQLQARASALSERVRQVAPEMAEMTTEKAKSGLQSAGRKPWLVPGVAALLTGVLLWRRMGRSR